MFLTPWGSSSDLSRHLQPLGSFQADSKTPTSPESHVNLRKMKHPTVKTPCGISRKLREFDPFFGGGFSGFRRFFGRNGLCSGRARGGGAALAEGSEAGRL